VPEPLKEERRARFMQVQQEISAQRLLRKVGRTLTVLVDGIDPQGVAVARSAADAPEIDGLVYVAKARKLQAGEFAQVRITRADTHDLHGEPAR
jgi:ribosomal protein S12 methylthiotransferase